MPRLAGFLGGAEAVLGGLVPFDHKTKPCPHNLAGRGVLSWRDAVADVLHQALGKGDVKSVLCRRLVYLQQAATWFWSCHTCNRGGLQSVLRRVQDQVPFVIFSLARTELNGTATSFSLMPRKPPTPMIMAVTRPSL
jgi:hypothetical protein